MAYANGGNKGRSRDPLLRECKDQHDLREFGDLFSTAFKITDCTKFTKTNDTPFKLMLEFLKGEERQDCIAVSCKSKAKFILVHVRA